MRCMYKPVPRKAILCDSCNKWFHLSCTTVNLKTYINPSSSDEKWFCDNCGWSINFTDSFFESSISTEQNVSSLTSVVSVDSSDLVFPTASLIVYHLMREVYQTRLMIQRLYY